MHSVKQNDRSVEDFGKELTELFVDLTFVRMYVRYMEAVSDTLGNDAITQPNTEYTREQLHHFFRD
jgi:hypothetical protein